MRRLNWQMDAEVKMLQKSLEGKQLFHEKIQAVLDVAGRVGQKKSSPLNLHLLDKCFKCGCTLATGKLFSDCKCRNKCALSSKEHEKVEVPKKKKGGKSLCGNDKRKRKHGQVRSASNQFRIDKWSKDVEEGIRRNNERKRTSGVRKRPSAAG